VARGWMSEWLVAGYQSDGLLNVQMAAGWWVVTECQGGWGLVVAGG
jgi:hypothetical protein